jgi:hypothetical protein
MAAIVISVPWSTGGKKAGFLDHVELTVPAGEDAEFFRIGEHSFLAVASIRTGRGPYGLNSHSPIFRWRARTQLPNHPGQATARSSVEDLRIA